MSRIRPERSKSAKVRHPGPDAVEADLNLAGPNPNLGVAPIGQTKPKIGGNLPMSAGPSKGRSNPHEIGRSLPNALRVYVTRGRRSPGPNPASANFGLFRPVRARFRKTLTAGPEL